MKLARYMYLCNGHRATALSSSFLEIGCCSNHHLLLQGTLPCRQTKQIFPLARSFNLRSSPSVCSTVKSLSTSVQETSASKISQELLECSDDATRTIAEKDFVIMENFVTEEEEKSLLTEVERFLKKTRYEYDHWDNAIHGFRETEKSKWSESNSSIIQRIRDVAFPARSAQLSLVHVLDLAQNGYIKPHVDSIKFCGDTIAGLCLNSPAIMRLVHTEEQSCWVNALLNPRSLYIMRGKMRYDYTHEVLKEEDSVFKGARVPRGRRISVMCRSEVTS